jgi:hypothetical protein
MRVLREKSVCELVGVNPLPPQPNSKLGIALSTVGSQPIHGIRHLPTESTNGWYIWCGGEVSQAEDFFAPLHVEHLAEHLPMVLDYLDLPPGYRFLIDGSNHEDVWFDEMLLVA